MISRSNRPLVLYSHEDHAWKIADFGLAAEVVSSRAYTTHSSRGTCCYRAPELVQFDKHTYTNKVDIWAMGCILHELVLGEKAFVNDLATFQYVSRHISSRENLPISIDPEKFPDPDRVSFLSGMINDMFEIDPLKRPEADHIYKSFAAWSRDSGQQATTSRSSPPLVQEYFGNTKATLTAHEAADTDSDVFLQRISSLEERIDAPQNELAQKADMLLDREKFAKKGFSIQDATEPAPNYEFSDARVLHGSVREIWKRIRRKKVSKGAREYCDGEFDQFTDRNNLSIGFYITSRRF